MDTVLYERRGGVAVVTLNRPGALNALDRQLRADLEAALMEAEADEGVHALVLTGAGRAFSVGQDVGELKRLYDEEGAVLGRLVEEEYAPLLGLFEELPMPTVAAVNGPAAGGGMALALAADIRLASPKASFIPAFVKVGLVPDSGASFHLVRMLGLAKALEVTMTGEAITAEEARRLGFVRQVAGEGEDVAALAVAFAAELAAGPRAAYPHIRRILRQATSATFEEVVALETDAQDQLGRTRDHHEAIDAFLAKRPPVFEGH